MWVSGKDWGEEKEKLAEQLRTIFHMVRVMMHKTYATISLLNSHQYFMNGEHPKLPQYCPNISSSATVEFKCSNILTTTLLSETALTIQRPYMHTGVFTCGVWWDCLYNPQLIDISLIILLVLLHLLQLQIMASNFSVYRLTCLIAFELVFYLILLFLEGLVCVSSSGRLSDFKLPSASFLSWRGNYAGCEMLEIL